MVVDFYKPFGKLAFSYIEKAGNLRIIVDENRVNDFIRSSGSQFIITNGYYDVPEDIKSKIIDTNILNWLTGYGVKFPKFKPEEVTKELLNHYIGIQKLLVNHWGRNTNVLNTAIRCSEIFRVIRSRFVSDMGPNGYLMKERHAHIEALGLAVIHEYVPDLFKHNSPNFLNKWSEIRCRELDEEFVRRVKPFGDQYTLIRFGRPKVGLSQQVEVFPRGVINSNDPVRHHLAGQIKKFFYQEDVRCYCRLLRDQAFILAPGSTIKETYEVEIYKEDIR